MTDGELLRRYVTDDSEAAFAEIVRRHLPLVYSTALRQAGGDTHLAHDALHELSAADREAVLLRFFQQRPFAEVGAALNLSEDAARMRVERALAKLHALLDRRGITSTAAALAVIFARGNKRSNSCYLARDRRLPPRGS